MQPIQWYLNRLRSMSAAEIAWRVWSELRDISDRFRVTFHLYPAASKICRHHQEKFSPGFRVPSPPVGFWSAQPESETETFMRSRLLAKAEEICSHRLSYFNLQGVFLGDPINWHRDQNLGMNSPSVFSQSIDYRDIRIAGDCKMVWEPNRHHQFVVLGRAWRASGDIKYAQQLFSQIDDWLLANPFGYGMNWRSPLELGIRLINWVWAIDLTLDSGIFQGHLKERILHAIYLHLWDITRKFSRGSSANNHLVGEAAGVFVATSYFPFMKKANQWRNEAKAILENEISAQSYADGCTREQALGYQLFVIQFYLFCELVGNWCADSFSSSYRERLEKMIEFVGRLTEGGGRQLPFFGDRDDGYVLDLGSEPSDPRGILAIGALLTNREDFKTWADGQQEMPLWLFGQEGTKAFAAIPESFDNRLLSWPFPESGYYLLQAGNHQNTNSISVLFDCAELGYGAIAAHGHADTLSLTLRVGGEDIFVDPGTYDYFTYPVWRKYFKSTRSHNTIEVDGFDQSMMLGPFLWGHRAQAKCVDWQPDSKGGGRVTGEHDGYMRLQDPVLHQRTLTLENNGNLLEINDVLEMCQKHTISLFFHVSSDCTISPLAGRINRYLIQVRDVKILFTIDEKLAVGVTSGCKNPISGWESLSYHNKIACSTIVAHGLFTGKTSFCCSVTHHRD